MVVLKETLTGPASLAATNYNNHMNHFKWCILCYDYATTSTLGIYQQIRTKRNTRNTMAMTTNENDNEQYRENDDDYNNDDNGNDDNDDDYGDDEDGESDDNDDDDDGDADESNFLFFPFF